MLAQRFGIRKTNLPCRLLHRGTLRNQQLRMFQAHSPLVLARR